MINLISPLLFFFIWSFIVVFVTLRNSLWRQCHYDTECHAFRYATHCSVSNITSLVGLMVLRL